MSQRTERVADLIRAELAVILQRDMKDPRVRLATISEVHVTRDLSHAKVFVSVLGTEDERLGCIQTLQRAQGFLRTVLAGKLRLRTTPELHFELDRGAEHSQRINELLESLHSDEKADS